MNISFITCHCGRVASWSYQPGPEDDPGTIKYLCDIHKTKDSIFVILPKTVCCYDCGIQYNEMGLDLVLPDQQWKIIFPEESGVLCANCICKRASRFGGTVILAWIELLNYSIQETNNDQETVFQEAGRADGSARPGG
jgi:hypothetical protein